MNSAEIFNEPKLISNRILVIAYANFKIQNEFISLNSTDCPVN